MSKVPNNLGSETATNQPHEDGADFRIATLPRLLTIDQAANLMELHVIDVWELVGSGALPGSYVGERAPGGEHETIWLHPRDVREHMAKLEPVDAGALRVLRMMADVAGVPIDLSDVKTEADASEAAAVIAQGMAVLHGKAS